MRRLSLCPLLLPLTACATDISGRYDLQSVDGEPLPWETIRYTGAEGQVLRVRELTASTLELNDDGTCRIVASSSDRDVPGADPERMRPPSTEVDDCTWTPDGSTLTLTSPDSPDDRALYSVANGVMTLTARILGEEVVFVYVLVER